jgi:hypothetical protein
MKGYISTRGRTIAITALVTAQIVLLAATVVAWLVYSASLESGDVEGPASVINALNPVNQILFLTAFIVFMTWVYRSMANLPGLGAMNLSFTPSGAVWAYFIPFVNLVRGHQVMATIWRESQPAAFDEGGKPLPRKATLVHWWWGLYIFNIVSSYALNDAHQFPVNSVEALRSTAQGQIFGNVLQAVEAVLFLLMVRGAHKRQDEQWQDLVRRQNVPQPTADALR